MFLKAKPSWTNVRVRSTASLRNTHSNSAQILHEQVQRENISQITLNFKKYIKN